MGVVLGGTVLRDQVASAKSLAQSVVVSNTADQAVPVREQNLDRSGDIKVHEQGIAAVNVTNDSLSVGLSPVTSGGGRELTAPGLPLTIPVATASALIVVFRGGASSVFLEYQSETVAVVEGAVAISTNGPETVPLALTRPIKFDRIVCFGVGGTCTIDWVGNMP